MPNMRFEAQKGIRSPRMEATLCFMALSPWFETKLKQSYMFPAILMARFSLFSLELVSRGLS